MSNEAAGGLGDGIPCAEVPGKAKARKWIIAVVDSADDRKSLLFTKEAQHVTVREGFLMLTNDDGLVYMCDSSIVMSVERKNGQ